eukprot:6745495-Prymnesium_polylepis.1
MHRHLRVCVHGHELLGPDERRVMPGRPVEQHHAERRWIGRELIHEVSKGQLEPKGDGFRLQRRGRRAAERATVLHGVHQARVEQRAGRRAALEHNGGTHTRRDAKLEGSGERLFGGSGAPLA